MFIQLNRRPSRAPAVLAMLALLALAPMAAAAGPDSPGETTDNGWKKMVAYARCAFEVFSAATPAQWAGAILDCGKQFLDEPPIGIGGV